MNSWRPGIGALAMTAVLLWAAPDAAPGLAAAMQSAAAALLSSVLWQLASALLAIRASRTKGEL
jgi:hypothetical protein